MLIDGYGWRFFCSIIVCKWKFFAQKVVCGWRFSTQRSFVIRDFLLKGRLWLEIFCSRSFVVRDFLFKGRL